MNNTTFSYDRRTFIRHAGLAIIATGAATSQSYSFAAHPSRSSNRKPIQIGWITDLLGSPLLSVIENWTFVQETRLS